MASCVTTEYIYIEPDPLIFPSKPGGVVLTESSPVNEYLLMVNDIEWLKWSHFVDREAGIITDEEYNEKIKRCNETLEKFNAAFRKYQESITE